MHVRIRRQLLSLYDAFPFDRHPLWQAILKQELSFSEVMRAEMQHFLRTKAGQQLRRQAMNESQSISETVFAAIIDTYLEECTATSGPSHLDLIRRLLVAGGVSGAQLEVARPTPGNSAAIALYQDIGRRGAACHILGAGVVEFFYSELSPRIFKVYTEDYGMTAYGAETYRVHGPMDKEHAERALTIAEEAVNIHGYETVELSVRDALVATSLHYDGMLQAAKNRVLYWEGAPR
jgi:pyrroloquinoline quinone (PQQ) biosynthesis protein C